MQSSLADVCKSLPPEDAKRIVIDAPHESLHVRADAARIELALRLIIGSTLVNVHDGKIGVVLRRRRKIIELTLAPHKAGKPKGRLKKLRPKPGEPLETASIIVAAHGGRIAGES